MRVTRALSAALLLACAPPAAAELGAREELEARSRALRAAAHADGDARLPLAPGRAGALLVVPGREPPRGRGLVRRFAVEVEGGLRVDRRAFAREVARTLADRRGWRQAGYGFARVDALPADFRVALASPRTTDRLCAPLATRGRLSCVSGRRAVLNVLRWRRGAAPYRKDLPAYRRYLVNHEVGHLLGRYHSSCPEEGARAPVMMQQTKGVDGCTPNAWPLPTER